MPFCRASNIFHARRNASDSESESRRYRLDRARLWAELCTPGGLCAINMGLLTELCANCVAEPLNNDSVHPFVVTLGKSDATILVDGHQRSLSRHPLRLNLVALFGINKTMQCHPTRRRLYP